MPERPEAEEPRQGGEGEGKGKETAIPPIPLAFLLCDQVITDAATKKKTVVGIFDRIWVSKFPTEHKPVALYARMYDAVGEHEVKVEYVKVSDETVLAQATGKLHVQDRHKPVEFAISFSAIPIPEPGEYEFRLWVGNRYVQRVRFTAELLPTQQR